MSSPEKTTLAVERVTFTSDRRFDDVLDRVYGGIGRPDMAKFSGDLAAARSFDEFEAVVHDAVGPSDLLRFLELDEDVALKIDPDINAYRLVRIIAGNPLTMSEMTRFVPDAGSYAPVTILVHQAADGVKVSYDTVASALRPYGDARAQAVAENLDRKVLALLERATAADN